MNVSAQHNESRKRGTKKWSRRRSPLDVMLWLHAMEASTGLYISSLRLSKSRIDGTREYTCEIRHAVKAVSKQTRIFSWEMRLMNGHRGKNLHSAIAWLILDASTSTSNPMSTPCPDLGKQRSMTGQHYYQASSCPFFY